MSAAVLAATLVALTYGALLGAWFHPVDDAIHLLAVTEGRYPLPHFRPLHEAWNRALFACFGTESFGWHLVGLVVHAATGWLLYVLVRFVGMSRVAAAIGAAAFVVLRAPSEAVAWISAASGLLSMLCVTASAVCWWRALSEARPRQRRTWWCASLLTLAAAMLSKEDCVVAGPLLVGLHVVRSGWRGVLRRESIPLYAPFALIAAAYLAVALDPGIWSEREGVGEYVLRPELVPRLFANLALLAWPGHVAVDDSPVLATLVGLIGVCALLGFALLVRRGAPLAARVIVLGLVVAAFGLLPVLPGPFEVVAASRMGYMSGLGLALVLAGCADVLCAARRARPLLTTIGLVGLCGFVLVNAVAVRRTVQWRYVDASHRFEALVVQTLDVAKSSERGSVLFLAPPGWNALDHVRAVQVFAPKHEFTVERVHLSAARLGRELFAWRERADLFLWVDGEWRPLRLDDGDRARLLRAAEANEQHGLAGVVPSTWVRR